MVVKKMAKINVFVTKLNNYKPVKASLIRFDEA